MDNRIETALKQLDEQVSKEKVRAYNDYRDKTKPSYLQYDDYQRRIAEITKNEDAKRREIMEEQKQIISDLERIRTRWYGRPFSIFTSTLSTIRILRRVRRIVWTSLFVLALSVKFAVGFVVLKWIHVKGLHGEMNLAAFALGIIGAGYLIFYIICLVLISERTIKQYERNDK